jgi:hypothetical protein
MRGIGVSENIYLSMSGHRHLLTRRDVTIFGLVIDLDADWQILGNARQKKPHFADVSIIYLKYGRPAEVWVLSLRPERS